MQTLSLSVTSEKPALHVNGCSIVTAPTVEEMYAILGEPTRIDSGESPAPVGHRNGRIHIYDELGVTINEHHYTYRIQSLMCWMNVVDTEFRFVPEQAFSGTLSVDGSDLRLGGNVRDFFASSPVEFGDGWGGSWSFRVGGFCVFLSSQGHRLRSGRRSKVRHVATVSLSWPHDSWQKPHAT